MPEAISHDGKYKVEWVFIGEGWNGDYDDTDPDDTALMRFDTYQHSKAVCDECGSEGGRHLGTCYHSNCDEDDFGLHGCGEWAEFEDGSYCTQTPYDTPDGVLVALAQLMVDRIADHPTRRTCEEMSWASPKWLHDPELDGPEAATPDHRWTVTASRCQNCGQVLQKGPKEWWHQDNGQNLCVPLEDR